MVGFVGLLIFACLFVPGVRAVFARILGLLLIGVGVAVVILIGWAIYRHQRRKRETEFAAAYLGTKAIEAEIKAIGKRQPSKFFSLWLPPIEVEAVDGIQPPDHPTAFSRELLDALEWRRFEELVTWYFRKTGFDAKRSRVGADGGVDILVHNNGENRPFAYVQCKAWHRYNVGIKPVRELFGVMASDKIQTGYFVTTGEFSDEAVRFAHGKEMTLIAGADLLAKIAALPELDRSEILQQVTAGDYTTPTCPRCDVKMVRRTGGGGDFEAAPTIHIDPVAGRHFHCGAGEAPRPPRARFRPSCLPSMLGTHLQLVLISRHGIDVCGSIKGVPRYTWRRSHEGRNRRLDPAALPRQMEGHDACGPPLRVQGERSESLPASR